MTTTHPTHPDPRVLSALAAPSASARLQGALRAGTHPAPEHVEPLVERCAVEPDFFVRDMLTWALTRHPSPRTVPRLLVEVRAGGPQARSQALHTLSKISDARGWSAITTEVLRDPDDDVARSAWRAALVLVPAGQEAVLAQELVTQLGRGPEDVQRSLSRAFAQLGEAALPVLHEHAAHDDEGVRAHAIATQRLVHDPDEDFGAALAEARRITALAADPSPGAARAHR